MKKLRTLLFALFISTGIPVMAQTETVASQPKKLEQLYLSLGTGPALTTSQTSRIAGGTYLVNITGAFGPTSVFRFNVQHSIFTSYRSATPGVFSYLSATDYYNYFTPDNRNTSISFSYGKRKKLNKLIQLQTMAGLGFNFIETYDFERMENNGIFICGTPYIQNFYKPGLLLQAEAMFLPSRFAGLTAGAYVNLTPKLPSAGINLSLNLGKIRTKGIL